MDWAILLSCGVALPGMTMLMSYVIFRNVKGGRDAQIEAVERHSIAVPQMDAWQRIARFVPNIREDLEFLRDQWNAIDASLDVGGLTTEEEALRRALRNDLPRIAETLEGAMAIASTDDERRMACASALGSLEHLLDILKAHRKTIFDAASSDQQVVGRYLETKRDDVAPSGALALPRRHQEDRPAPDLSRHLVRPNPTVGVDTPTTTVTSRSHDASRCSFCGMPPSFVTQIEPGATICRGCAEELSVSRKPTPAEPPETPPVDGGSLHADDIFDDECAEDPANDLTDKNYFQRHGLPQRGVFPRYGVIIGNNHFH